MEPFGEFHRISLIAAFNATGALGKGGGWIGFLEKRDNTSDYDGCAIAVEATRFIMGSATRSFFGGARAPGRRVRQFHQCFKAVADDVDVREFRFVGQDFPRWKEERLGQPGFDVLLQAFLGLEAFGDDDDWALRKFFANEGGDECVGGGWHAGIRQCSAPLQRAEEVLHGWRFLNVPERTICHYSCGNVQAGKGKVNEAGRGTCCSRLVDCWINGLIGGGMGRTA